METSLPYRGDSTAPRVNTNKKLPTVRGSRFETMALFIIVICVVPFCEIAIATQNLKNANLTREGGFGSVYKAD
ncbi:hypothetical protein L1987_63356 [Smallanthus sonchifolius]|uniref:Uncharacterized protein n=1 Tax=Smallanthus sonchifolius TaxID=185202 RepID=A0ACB9CD19_9ASTR|nr:hypothetical protein L1987_63356 [Smallanthus sonchifolius]